MTRLMVVDSIVIVTITSDIYQLLTLTLITLGAPVYEYYQWQKNRPTYINYCVVVPNFTYVIPSWI